MRRRPRAGGCEFWPTLEGTGADRLCVSAHATDHESRMTTREVLREFSRRQRLARFPLRTVDPRGRPGSPARPRWPKRGPPSFSSSPAPRTPRDWLAPSATIRDSERTALSAGRRFSVPAKPLGRTRFRELAGDAAEAVRFPLLARPPAPARRRRGALPRGVHRRARSCRPTTPRS